MVNKPDHGTLDWVKICEKSAKVITFIDLAGHERYLKTTVFGMTGHVPDFGMLMVINNNYLWRTQYCNPSYPLFFISCTIKFVDFVVFRLAPMLA